jgi:hypothetical protein
MDVLLLIVYDSACILPKLTAIAPVKLLPVMVTLVPPPVVPDVTDSPVTVGALAEEKVNCCVEPDTADEPVGVHTVTATSGGVTAVICVDELTVKLAASTPPNRMSLAPLKSVPVMTTVVPPAVLPELVPSPVMAGGLAALKVKRAELLGAELPAVVCTTTSTVPALVGGVTEVI